MVSPLDVEVWVEHRDFHLQLLHVARARAWIGQAAAYGGGSEAVVSVRRKPGRRRLYIPAENEAMIKEDPLCLRSFAHLASFICGNPSGHRRLSQRDSFSKVAHAFFPSAYPLCTAEISNPSKFRYSRRFAASVAFAEDPGAGADRAQADGRYQCHYRSITILDLKR